MTTNTILVKDANANTVTVPTLPALGAATSANSLPVTIATDQTPVPVAVATSQVTPTVSAASTLTMTSATTAYSAGQLVASSSTANSIVNPSFALPTHGAAIPRLRLSVNDTTSTAWGGVAVQVDLWSATPTWTNGDRGAWLPATGAGIHLGSFTCVLSSVWGDGACGECVPTVGGYVSQVTGPVYWSLQTLSATGVTGASKIWTLQAELN